MYFRFQAVKRAILFCCLLAVLTDSSSGQDVCNRASNCSQCLNAGPQCSWCADTIDSWEGNRCQLQGNANAACNGTINPQSESEIVPNYNKVLGGSVQVRPQRYSVKLRPSQSVQLTIAVRPAANYPLDVYYLMDHSHSMRDDLTTLQNQAVSIAKAINDVSSNYTIGYGSYVDKTAAPFALVQGPKVVQPCADCDRPYSFANTLPLTHRGADVFRKQLKKENISGNVDAPEGTLEAMMQAAVCKKDIGWRDNARHVLVVATDAGFHSAGDGRLAGIITPNDGLCHMDADQMYTYGLKQDYPSVSFLNYKLQQQDVLPIFTVTTPMLPQYQALSGRISGSIVVNMTQNSAGIVEILKRELARLVEVAKITVLPHAGVKVEVTASCPSNGRPETDENTGFQQCNNMEVNKQATFKVRLTAGNCALLQNLKNITIRVVGFGDVIVDVEPLCQCHCEKNPTLNSSWCSGQGSDSCGVCLCYSGFQNDKARCDCDMNSMEPCKDKEGAVCANRGKCECGRCNCSLPEFTNQHISGDFCECDNFTCPKDSRGRVCGGSQQGTCECRRCVCKDNYYGEQCDCYSGNDTCIAKGDKRRICKGEGECECGKCKCYECFSGEFCDLCTCPPEQCKKLDVCFRSTPCLKCPVKSDDEQCAKCRGTRSIAPPSSLPHYIDGVEAKQCEATDDDDCDYYYWVAVNSNDGYSFYPLEIENKRSCPEKFDYLPLVLGIVFGLVLAGLLLLLIWRIFAYYKDLQEYKRFLQSQSNQDWSKVANPFYQKPIQNFVNPQYEGN